jgi:mannitol/fructose-specific phosphotransferase system IIA component (Ntr-type)
MDLRDLLRPSLVSVNEQAEDWQSAIRVVGDLMVADGAVEPRFVDAMILVAIEFGPYIVIAPGIALPHARPEDGVIRASIAIVTLTTPVNFGNPDNDPVTILVALAAVDHNQHIEGLGQLAQVLGDDANVSKILDCQTKEELLEIFWRKVPSD